MSRIIIYNHKKCIKSDKKRSLRPQRKIVISRTAVRRGAAAAKNTGKPPHAAEGGKYFVHGFPRRGRVCARFSPDRPEREGPEAEYGKIGCFFGEILDNMSRICHNGTGGMPPRTKYVFPFKTARRRKMQKSVTSEGSI